MSKPLEILVRVVTAGGSALVSIQFIFYTRLGTTLLSPELTQ